MEVDDFLSYSAQRQCPTFLFVYFRRFEIISKHLHTQKLMLSEVRFASDSVFDDYTEVTLYFSAHALIFQNHFFANVIVKMMDRNNSQLTANDLTAVKALAVRSGPACEEDIWPSPSHSKRTKAKRHRLSSTENQHIFQAHPNDFLHFRVSVQFGNVG